MQGKENEIIDLDMLDDDKSIRSTLVVNITIPQKRVVAELVDIQSIPSATPTKRAKNGNLL